MLGFFGLLTERKKKMTEPIQTFVCQGKELATYRYLAAKIFPHLTYFSAVRALPKFTEILPILEFSDEKRQHFSQKHQVQTNLNLFDKKEADRVIDALVASDLPPARFIGQYKR